MRRRDGAVVRVGAGLAIAGAVHAWWNLRQLRVLQPPPPSASPRDADVASEPSVSVLIPARDEAGRIGHCLRAALDQRCANQLEILVFDDRSSDGTAQVVGHQLGDSRVRLIESGGDPPSGWLGKTWACHELAQQASGDVLVFVDADVRLASDAISRIATSLSSEGWDAVSPYPRQVAVTWPERVVQPLLQWSWSTFLPLRMAETSARPSMVAANGQVLAVTREAYEDCGGHASVRDEVLDDVALFGQLKRSGRRPVLADGTDVATCRMYDDWATLRDGYSKSLWAATSTPAGAAALAGLLGLAYVMPPLAALTRGSRAGAVGYAAAVASRAIVARRVGGRVWPDSLLHPASVAVFGHLLARSWIGRKQGTLTWKSRRLPTNPVRLR